MKHLRILLKANYLVDNYKHMKNFQALSQSDSLSRWAHAHFKKKNEKDGKTDLICTQLTTLLTFYWTSSPVQNFIKMLIFDTYLRKISFLFQSLIYETRTTINETIIPEIEMFFRLTITHRTIRSCSRKDSLSRTVV